MENETTYYRNTIETLIFLAGVALAALWLNACGGGSDGGNVPLDSNGNPLPTSSETTINCDESGNPQQCSGGTCTPVDEATPDESTARAEPAAEPTPAPEAGQVAIPSGAAWKFITKIGDITIDGVVQCGAEINISESTVTTTTDTDVNSGNPDNSTNNTDSNNTNS